MADALFGLTREVHKPTARERLRVLVTVKAAPNPSEKSGETVCVAGLALRGSDMDMRWVRLYPINFRYLEADLRFRKYDIIEVDATPAKSDPRVESWRPVMSTMKVVDHLDPWTRRRGYLDAVVEDSMCALNDENRAGATGRSLALIHPREVTHFDVAAHEGWTPAEEGKIDRYVNQLSLLPGDDRTPLEAPRMRGWYRYRCWAKGCNGPRQGVLDWEFVALQRQASLRSATDEHLKKALRAQFLDTMCANPDRDLAFYVGNQSKRHHVFSVLGVYYPD